MCQNKEVSFLLALFAAVVAIKFTRDFIDTREQKYLFAAAYVLILGLVQFTEFFIHWYADAKKSKVYQVASLFLVLNIVLQFVLSEVLVFMHGGAPAPMCVLDVAFYLILLWLAPVLYRNFGKFNNETACSSLFGCKLEWSPWILLKDANKFLFAVMFLIYFAYFAYATYLLFGWLGLAVYFITAGAVYFPALVFAAQGRELGGTGSIWCVLAALMTILVILGAGDQGLRDQGPSTSPNKSLSAAPKG